MLRAYSFTLTALNAVTGLTLILGNDGIFSLGTEFRLAFLAVFHIEDVHGINIKIITLVSTKN